MSIFRRIGSLWRWWVTPRATERDEAFRERSIRLTIGIVLIFTLLNFASIVFIYRNEWGLISFPTLHIIGLVGFTLSAVAVSRQRIFVSGWLHVITIALASGGIVLLARQTASPDLLQYATPVFMLSIVISSLVLPRNQIILVSTINFLIYFLTFVVIQLEAEIQLVPSVSGSLVGTYILFLLEGALLRQLRSEFDARLDEMRKSIKATEQAKEQAEIAWQQADADRQRAEDADRAKSQFLANMSHELRTPLNAIIGYDEAMLAGMAGEFSTQQHKLLGHIQHNSRRLLSLINDILDLSKIESGSLEVYWAPMEPAKVIQDSVEGLRNLAEEKGIVLELALDNSIPELVMSDAKKVEQILVNLLSNAIKFTDDGGVSVRVKGTTQNTWQITIQDTGIGIPDDALQTIFEPFRQLDATPKRKYKGTGLGLSITKRLVETLGGDIEVVSEVGAGSMFTVTLPRLNEKPNRHKEGGNRKDNA